MKVKVREIEGHEFNGALRGANNRRDAHMKTLLAIVALLATINAHALELNHAVQVNLASYHFYREMDWNEQNEGLGIETELVNTSFHISAGFYDNSFGDLTTYYTIGYERDLLSARGAVLSAGADIGLVTGYEQTPAMALPYVKARYKQLSFKSHIAPLKYGFMTFALQYDF